MQEKPVNFIAFLSLNKVVVLLFLITLVSSLCVHFDSLEKYLLGQTDSMGYYQYLPTWFCEGELLPDTYVVRLENGNPLSIFSFGVAILQAPFFLVGHLFASGFGYSTAGYSPPYAIAQLVSTSFYLAFSIWLLGKYLAVTFSKNVVLFSVLAIYLGTNLYYYSSFDAGMSHTYNFFLFALLILTYQKLLSTKKGVYLVILGITIGLLTLVKPYNLLGLLWIVPFSKSKWNESWQLIRKNILMFFLALFLACSLLFSQMFYWFLVSGNFLLFSYGTKGEGFNWTSPELIKVLFSVQNGWFIYTPLMFLSFIGIGIMLKSKDASGLKIAIILVLIYYIISSWWAWWFGGAFGHRAFVEYYAFLVIPLAKFIEYVLTKRAFIKTISISLIVIFCFVNIRMSYLYQHPWEGENWTWYNYNVLLNKVFFIK